MKHYFAIARLPTSNIAEEAMPIFTSLRCGASGACDLVLFGGRTIAAEHCEFQVSFDSRLLIKNYTDMFDKQLNDTYINGKKILTPDFIALNLGDIVHIGCSHRGFEFTFEVRLVNQNVVRLMNKSILAQSRSMFVEAKFYYPVENVCKKRKYQEI